MNTTLCFVCRHLINISEPHSGFRIQTALKSTHKVWQLIKSLRVQQTLKLTTPLFVQPWSLCLFPCLVECATLALLSSSNPEADTILVSGWSPKSTQLALKSGQVMFVDGKIVKINYTAKCDFRDFPSSRTEIKIPFPTRLVSSVKSNMTCVFSQPAKYWTLLFVKSNKCSKIWQCSSDLF